MPFGKGKHNRGSIGCRFKNGTNHNRRPCLRELVQPNEKCNTSDITAAPNTTANVQASTPASSAVPPPMAATHTANTPSPAAATASTLPPAVPRPLPPITPNYASMPTPPRNVLVESNPFSRGPLHTNLSAGIQGILDAVASSGQTHEQRACTLTKALNKKKLAPIVQAAGLVPDKEVQQMKQC